MGFWKKGVESLTSVVQNYFDERGVNCIMSSQVQILTWLQLILHVPRMQKAHAMYGASLQLSLSL